MPQNQMRRPHRPPLGPPGLRPPGIGPLRPPPPLGMPPHLGPRGPPLGLPPLPVMGPPPPPPGPGSVVSSCTNSTDPESMDSRLFVGNLNTVVLSKEDLEGIFMRYGYILGISMHKGYAFVQFSHPDEARRAGASEDGQLYAGQAIDINIVSQPKNRNALKRSAGPRSANDTTSKKSRADNPGTNQSLQRTLVTLSGDSQPTKKVTAKPAVTKSPALTAVKAAVNTPKAPVASTPVTHPPVAHPPVTVNKPPVVKTNWPDVLICGVCKLQFTSLHSLAQHKKIPCQLRVSTQAKHEPADSGDTEEPLILICAVCDTEFISAWALCLHCTQEHSMNIYKTEMVHDIDNLGNNSGQN